MTALEQSLLLGTLPLSSAAPAPHPGHQRVGALPAVPCGHHPCGNLQGQAEG